MDVCCEYCVLSGRGLCDGLIIRSEDSYLLWRVAVCNQVTSYARRLKARQRAVKYTPTMGCVAPGEKYWAMCGLKFSGLPGVSDYRGITVVLKL